MNLTSLFKRLFVISFCLNIIIFSASAKEPSADTTQQQGVPFTGLTQTLSNLLKTRNPAGFVLGSYEVFPEDLIEKDMASIFDCDSVISRYLDEAGDWATYDMLSYEMSRAIESRFHYDDGYLYVIVSSDTTAGGMYFNISISRGRPVSLPVVLHASDTSFSASFDTSVTAIFNADIDLFVNAAQAIADSQSRATRVRINTFTFEISSDPDNEEFSDYDFCNDESEDGDFSPWIQNPPETIPFNIGGTQYCAAVRCFALYAKTYWYLNPADALSDFEDEGFSHTLTFEQIEKGDFSWGQSHLSSLMADMVMIPADEDWDSIAVSENRVEFEYIVDDLFDENSLEQISLCCDFRIKDGVTLRNKKYRLRP